MESRGDRAGRRTALSRSCCAVLCAVSALLVVSCATSKGRHWALSCRREGAAASSPRSAGNPPQEPSQNPPGSSKGLQVLTDPSSAEVWIDGDFKGLSPFVMEDISVGWHRIVLRKEGYYESSGWVEFKGDPLLYQTSLAEIIGFLQISGDPGGRCGDAGRAGNSCRALSRSAPEPTR